MAHVGAAPAAAPPAITSTPLPAATQCAPASCQCTQHAKKRCQWRWSAPRRRGAGTQCEFVPRIHRANSPCELWQIVCTCQLPMHAACQKRWRWAAPRRRGAAAPARRANLHGVPAHAMRIRRIHCANYGMPCEFTLWHCEWTRWIWSWNLEAMSHFLTQSSRRLK